MKQRNRSPGFSLILSLTVMAGIVMLLVTVSAFVSIESRSAMNQQLATRAKLNAIVAMRLALAHLQQEAGPDRRATARGDITQPDATPSTVKNPMWTGIWRSDFPDLPPAWLISGRGDQPAGTQSISLFQTTASPDYHPGYWAPWQGGYNPTSGETVQLVGLGSALPDENGNLSGLISLPKITLPDESIAGTYAYWIGDEGVKARINLRDTRVEDPQDAAQLISLRSPLAQGLLKSLAEPSKLESFTRLKEAPLVGGIKDALKLGDLAGVGKYFRKHYHSFTTVSASVLADSLHGGLKRDLSTAFELADDQFAATEFGQGATGAAATHLGRDFSGSTSSAVSSFGVNQMPVLKKGGDPKEFTAAPVFTHQHEVGGEILTLRGPTWWALRDYHRLYKSLGWTAQTGLGGSRSTSTPTLLARALWPNVAAAHPDGKPASSGLANNSLRERAYSYSDIYDANQSTSGGPLNPNATDLLNGDSGRIITRPLAVSATPYVQRVSLAFSVNKMQWFEWRQIKIGKNIFWYQVETVDLRINITPIVVMHNPYNVQLTWRPDASTPSSSNKKAFGVALSVADIANWQFIFKQYGSPGGIFRTPLSDFFKRQSDDVDVTDTFRLYLANNSTEGNTGTSAPATPITLEPGEFRVFSCEPKFGEWSKDIVLGNAYSTRGGFRDNVLDWNLGPDAETVFDINSPIGMEIAPYNAAANLAGRFRLRQAVASRPEDQLILDSSGASADKKREDFFFDNSEAAEIVFTDIKLNKYPSPGEKFFMSWRHVRNKTADGLPDSTQPTLEPDLISVIDITTKPADSADAPFPALTHSNPLAPVQRASAGGRLGNSTGYLGASPSYQLSIRRGAWENVLESPPYTNGKKAYGGYSMTSNGADRVILAEIPLVQPTSLANYTHANFGVRDQQPLLAIGNSFASPFVATDKAYQENGNAWTELDQSYLLNAALWDSFFLSSIAPWMKTGSDGAVAPAKANPPDITVKNNDPKKFASDSIREARSTDRVIQDFVLQGTLLDNPRFSLERGNKDVQGIQAALGDYRLAASVLMNQGAFNVNSTSVEAWTSFLGSAKAFAVNNTAKNFPELENNGRFPRTQSKAATPPPVIKADSNDLGDPSNWSGFANLNDTQITALAQAIVTENKLRFGLSRRSERDLVKPPATRLFGSLAKPATPYLGLSEFINRFLSADAWAGRTGTLQAAIFRADQDNLGKALYYPLSKKTGNYELTENKLLSLTAGTFPHPTNVEIPRPASVANPIHTGLAAPGNLLQSDLLQSFGSALTTRSDTFTLRCFGEAIQTNGEMGGAWMEVIVQRLPEFIDATNAPETGNSAPRPLKITASAATDATISTALSPVNNILGRRFKVISMRWLKADEI